MSYTVGQKVNIVPLSDQDVALPPRVVLRGRNIYQVGTDLTDPEPDDVDDEPLPVSKLRIYYSYLPDPLDHSDKDTEIQLPLQFQELLVIDLAKELLRKTLTMNPEQKEAAIALLQQEEDKLMESFMDHVRTYAGDLVQRFDRQTTIVAP